MKKLRILYLAQNAPRIEDIKNNKPESDYVNAIYHFDLYQELKKIGSEVISVRKFSDVEEHIDDVDIIYSVYNQAYFRNSEIFVSAYAEYKGKPYIGARPNIRAIAEDKHLSKFLASKIGVPTPEWCVYNVGTKLSEPDFKGPYFVKPRFGSNSFDIEEENICADWTSAKNIINKLYKKKIDVIVEKHIVGMCNTVPVLDNFTDTFIMDAVHLKSDKKDNIITNKQKIKHDKGFECILSDDKLLNKQLSYYVKKYMDEIQPCDYARFDFITDEVTGISYFIELNICCSLGKHAAFAVSAKHHKISYEALISNIFYSSVFRQINKDEDFLKFKINHSNKSSR